MSARRSTQLPTDNESLYLAELDWYFNQYAYECGLKSVGHGLELAFAQTGNTITPRWLDDGTANDPANRKPWTPNVKRTGQTNCGTPNTDPWASGAKLASFAYGRLVWAKLGRLPYAWQDALKRHYEPQHPDSDLSRPPLNLIATIHDAYNGKLWLNTK